jgi:hypothetical protein
MFVCSALFSGLPGAPEWLSTRVLACGIVAIGLLILSLMLRGLQKVIGFLVIGVIAVGSYWFVQDHGSGAAAVMPPELAAELEGMAARGLENPEAKAAWDVIQKEWAQLTGQARARLAAGGDQARAAVARRMDAKSAELRRQGKKTAAEELARLREKVSPGS